MTRAELNLKRTSTSQFDLFNGHNFPFLFRLPRTRLFMNNSDRVHKKAEDAYPSSAPMPYSQLLVESGLLIYFCCFVYMILVTLLCCVCVFFMFGLCPWITFF